jgi:hypothetical protein
MNHMTLATWQTTEKPRTELLYNCSVMNGSDGWLPFSIGMGWSIINYHDSLHKTQIGAHEHLVFCAIKTTTDTARRPTHPIRRDTILTTLASHGISNTYLPYNQYFNTLPSYKFVISPEGNGIDCHRHYEALMAGCIPIIEDHEGIREKYKGCPVLYTKDYSEITPAYLEQKYMDMVNETYDFTRLFMSSHSAEEQAQIRTNGNYWSHRLTGRNWYN